MRSWKQTLSKEDSRTNARRSSAITVVHDRCQGGGDLVPYWNVWVGLGKQDGCAVAIAIFLVTACYCCRECVSCSSRGFRRRCSFTAAAVTGHRCHLLVRDIRVSVRHGINLILREDIYDLARDFSNSDVHWLVMGSDVRGTHRCRGYFFLYKSSAPLA